MSYTRTEEILETPNSTVWPGYNSIAAKSLRVSSVDESADGAFAADEEEDDIAMYLSTAAHGFLDVGQISDVEEQGGQASRRAGERFQKFRVFWRTYR
jgi:hypothetical protein